MTAANEKRHHVLVGARVVDVRRDGELVHLTLEHEDREDADATVPIRAPETKWLYPYVSVVLVFQSRGCPPERTAA